MCRRFLVVVALLLVGGCSQNSFVGSRLGNFTAYYNTFYNAEKAYEEGVKALDSRSQDQPLDPNVYLPLFGSEDRPAQSQLFDDAIKKSSDILRDHPTSKWVDDALLLIGKSYFYLQNYVGAEEKFGEVMTLESPLVDEARFWLARTYIASAQYDAAANHLQESLIREDLSKRWEPQLRLALGSLYVKREDWDAAVAELETGLENVRDNDLAARAQYLLGQVYETLKRYEEAVAAYERVSKFNPLYQQSYAAQFSTVRVEGMHIDPEEALRKLRRMERDDKNYENRAELAYLRGRIYQAAGDPEDALDAYYTLLYDSDANITAVRGRTHYALGEFYRDVYEDYPLAAAHFDTASSSLRSTSTARGASGVQQEAYAPAAITDAVDQARTFGSFAEVMGNIHQMDSLLYLGSLDDESFQEIVLELRRQRAEELAAQREAIAQRQAEQAFAGNNFGTQGGQRNPNQPSATPGTGSDGFLYYKNPIQVQENLANFEQRWGERPLVPNWRRIEAVRGIGSGATQEAPGAASGVDPQLAQQATLPEVDITGVPRDSLSQLEMRARRARARYELGNVLFLSMSRPDSAAVWYRKIIEEDGEEPVAQRAYYALAEVQRALGDTVSSNRLYEVILDQYPASEFAARSRERLGRSIQVAADSLTLAEAAYDAAYAIWQDERYEASLNDMVEVAVAYRDTPVAPRALLAAGKVYMAWASRDGLDLFAPLPLTVSDSLLLEGGLLKVVSKPLPVQVESASRPPASADTLTVPSGNLGAASDTLVVPSDNVAVPPDTMGEDGNVDSEEGRGMDDQPLISQEQGVDDVPLKPTIPLRADSLGAGMPTAPASSSSALGQPVGDRVETMGVGADTTALEYEPVRLESLYNTLVNTYPQAPQTAQARRVLTALKERQAALQAEADSIAAAQVPADSTAAPAEALPDSVAAPPAIAERDTEAGEQKESAMGAVGAMLRDKESRTPQDSAEEANRSARLRDTLERRQEEAAGRRQSLNDSTGVLLPDEEPPQRRRTEPADTSIVPALPNPETEEVQTDSLTTPRQPVAETTDPTGVDSTVAKPPPPRAQPEPGRAPGLTAQERARGGWTVVVASEGSLREAELRLPLFRTRLQTAGYPVDVFAAEDTDPPRYRIGLGLFTSLNGATSALARLAPQLPDDAWVLKVPPSE